MSTRSLARLEPAIEKNCVVHVPDNVIKLYPKDPDLAPFNAMSYLDTPLRDVDGGAWSLSSARCPPDVG
jgi:hypothetical protein